MADRLESPTLNAIVVTLLAFALLAAQPRTARWALSVPEFEILIQLSPVFVLGSPGRGGNRG